MIHVSPPQASTGDALSASEQHGLAVLLDLSRLVPVVQPAQSVRLETIPSSRDTDLATCLKAEWHLQVGDGVVTIPRDVLSVVTEVAGAVDEQRSERRDRYGRVLPTDNALVRLGAADEPVISRAAAALRQAVVRAAGRRPVALLKPWPAGKRWAVALTHDLDVVAWWPGFALLRLLELTRKGKIRLAARVGAAAVGSALHNPVERAARSILAKESRSGIPSTWFILCGSPTAASIAAGDLTYRPESRRTRRILSEIEKGGHEVGLHGSFATYDHPDLFREQRSRLADLSRAPATGVRQHFLRMVPGATQRAMTGAGFGYDSTFGFADRNGFRLGVADVVPMWDEGRQQTLAIYEAPFTWMDRALSKYQGIEDPRAWVEDGLRVAERVKETEGLWVGIWHPNLDTSLGYPDALDGFELLISRLAAQEPYFTSIGNAVRWRIARRQARISGIHPDGVPELRAPDSGVGEIELETPGSTPMRSIRAAN